MQQTHLWQVKLGNNKNKTIRFLLQNICFYFNIPMTKNHGNEDCRGTVNMYQIKCNLPLESMNTTQNSMSNNF